MFISDFAIKRPIVTITCMVALVVFGVIALFNLETDEFPDVQQPVIGVTVVYPGASPDVVVLGSARDLAEGTRVQVTQAARPQGQNPTTPTPR